MPGARRVKVELWRVSRNTRNERSRKNEAGPMAHIGKGSRMAGGNVGRILRVDRRVAASGRKDGAGPLSTLAEVGPKELGVRRIGASGALSYGEAGPGSPEPRPERPPESTSEGTGKATCYTTGARSLLHCLWPSEVDSGGHGCFSGACIVLGQPATQPFPKSPCVSQSYSCGAFLRASWICLS